MEEEIYPFQTMEAAIGKEIVSQHMGRLSDASSYWERHSLSSVALNPREVFFLKDNKGLTIALSIIRW